MSEIHESDLRQWRKFATIVLVFALISVGTVVAVSYIWSNIVTVTVTPATLTLEVTPTTVVNYENVSLTATLIGVPSVGGKIVYFYKNNGTQYLIGNNTTNSLGIATFTYLVFDNVTSISFQAKVEVP